MLTIPDMNTYIILIEFHDNKEGLSFEQEALSHNDALRNVIEHLSLMNLKRDIKEIRVNRLS